MTSSPTNHIPQSQAIATSATRWIRAMGIANTLVLLSYLLASPFLAAVMPVDKPRGAEGWGTWFTRLPAVPETIASAARGSGPLSDPRIVIATYGALLSMSTLLWVSGLALVARYRHALDQSHARAIVRWSLIFTAILIPAIPAVHDLWLGVAWGRMVADGINPYYVAPVALSDLPYRGVNPGTTTYGPLWTLISGAVAFLAGGNALAIVAIHKLLIAACWIGVIHVVHAMVRTRTAFEQCTALIVVGWAPVALMIGVGDGHNDPLLVLPMLLWLYWLERERPIAAGLALGVSASIKYVTLPLLLLQGVKAAGARGRERASAVLSVVAPLAVIALFLMFFYRSTRFFDSARDMRGWTFLTPASAIDTVARWVGVTSAWLKPAVNLAVIAIATWCASIWLRTRSTAGFRTAVLWIMSGVMLSLLGHVWPWFILWLLPLAAIQPGRRLSWFVFGLAAAAPFCVVQWAIFPGSNLRAEFIGEGPLLYLVAVGALLAGAPVRRWLTGSQNDDI